MHLVTKTSETPFFHPVDVVIMAAGKGTRMRSALPKVLHPLAGTALISHVLNTAAALGARKAVAITGFEAEQVEQHLRTASGPGAELAIDFVRQEPQLGTGHAVQQAAPVLDEDGIVVVLSGDVPLIEAHTLAALVHACGNENLALLTLDFEDPTGYGRIVRNTETNEVLRIVEQKDANPEELVLKEAYSGMLAVPARYLKQWLERLDNKNAQGEYYLTDIVRFAVLDGVSVVAHKIDDPLQVAGVNNPEQLAELEQAYLAAKAEFA